MWARRADTEEILDILVLLNATTPNCPFWGLDAIAFAVRCERRQHDREAKTRTLEEEAVSDNSPSASKQRGHSSHLPLSSSTDNFALSPLQRVHTLRLQKTKKKNLSLYNTVFFFVVVVVVGAMMMDISRKCWSSYRLKSPFCEESVW